MTLCEVMAPYPVIVLWHVIQKERGTRPEAMARPSRILGNSRSQDRAQRSQSVSVGVPRGTLAGLSKEVPGLNRGQSPPDGIVLIL